MLGSINTFALFIFLIFKLEISSQKFAICLAANVKVNLHILKESYHLQETPQTADSYLFLQFSRIKSPLFCFDFNMQNIILYIYISEIHYNPKIVFQHLLLSSPCEESTSFHSVDIPYLVQNFLIHSFQLFCFLFPALFLLDPLSFFSNRQIFFLKCCIDFLYFECELLLSLR